MALAKKCNRCGKYYDGYNSGNNPKKINGIIPVNIDHEGRYFSHSPIDFCPECKEDFERWLNNYDTAEVE